MQSVDAGIPIPAPIISFEAVEAVSEKSKE
jgi:hypothetical protein